MKDTELYRLLLGIDLPWSVSRVEVDAKGQRVDVWVEHAPGTKWACPACSKELAAYDHSEDRAWRHLDSCQFSTYLHARPPRVECPDHGVRQVKLPWAEPHSRFSAMFESLAIRVMLEADVEGSCRVLRTSWDEAWGLQEHAVSRGLRRKGAYVSEKIGVDEKAIAKGHKYLTLVCDLNRGTVEYVGKDRQQSSLNKYFSKLSKEQLNGIQAVAMDMWRPYLQSVTRHVPEAEKKIVIDRFHLMGHMGRAVNSVRRREHWELRKEGEESLKGSKYLWLYSEENIPEKAKARFALLKAMNLKTSRAWAIKESLRGLWECPTEEAAQAHWQGWYQWATHSALKPVVKAAKTLKGHLTNVMTYFKHRVTTALCEGMNSKIQTIKKMACGFRSWENFKTAIFFHCGGLHLQPGTHGNPG